jgi:hypothetical protein
LPPPLLFFVVFSLGSVQIGLRLLLALPFLFVFCALLRRSPPNAPVSEPRWGPLVGHALAPARRP